MNIQRKRRAVLFLLVSASFLFLGCKGVSKSAVYMTGESLQATGSSEMNENYPSEEPEAKSSLLPQVNATVAATPDKPVKAIALTFDDGPDTGDTKATTMILNVLEETGAKATFFVVGQAAAEWFPTSGSEAMKRAVSLGCEIGTHTYSHENLNKADDDVIAEEVEKSCQVIENITGQKVKLMRPPYGNANENVLSKVDLPMIQWDVDTLDWETKDPDKTVENILDSIKPGSIVLMHDIYGQTAEAVEKVIPKLMEEGYQLVTVSELFELYGKTLEGHQQYYYAR